MTIISSAAGATQPVRVGADITVNGHMVVSTLTHGQAFKIVSASLSDGASSSGDSGVSGTLTVDVSSDVGDTLRMIDPDRSPIVQAYAEWGSYRCPIGNAAVGSAGATPETNSTTINIPLIGRLTPLADAELTAGSKFTGEGTAAYYDGSWAWTVDGLAAALAAEGDPSLESAVSIGKIEGGTVELSAVPLKFDAGSSVMEAVRRVVGPYGLVPHVDRWGILNFHALAERRAPAFSVGPDDVAGSPSISGEGEVVQGVRVFASSADSTVDQVVVDGWAHPAAASPLHVDPRDTVHSSFGPPTVVTFDMVGATAGQAAEAAGFRSAGVDLGKTVQFRLKTFRVVDVMSTFTWVWPGTDPGLYRVVGVSYGFKPEGATTSVTGKKVSG